ncbi:hypothetical protein K402DRAFT_314953, partial [Aulographum hederae CBS 113979]
YYDASTSSLAFYHGNCDFTGLSMDRDTDGDEMSPCFETQSVGTARMSIAYGELVWEDNRWGSWLVCQVGDRVELSWWDVITDRGIDTGYCAKVALLLENL